jgi:very-short-patch-repair endonuclease
MDRDPRLISFAKAMRRDPTDAEYKLWFHLKRRSLNGYKFSRQIAIGSYIADFVCREQCLIIELDGEQHADNSYDETRTESLNAQGYSVLRFWNHEILHETEAVLDTILAVLEHRISYPSPGLRFAQATLSPEGRGKIGSFGR